MWARKLEGRCWLCTSVHTCPQAKPAQEQSWGQENSQQPQDYKRNLSGDATPLHPGGTSAVLGPTPRLQLISQRKHIFLSGANRNQHTSREGIPCQCCCAGGEMHSARLVGECFASFRAAVYGTNTSLGWAVVAGGSGGLQGRCLPSPIPQRPSGGP